MTRSVGERALVGLLYVEAAVLLCAAPAVLLPTEWMAAIHEGLGMGPLPRGPLVEYLTRSLSMVYAMLAPVLIALAWDVRRYLPLIRLTGWLHLIGAAILFFLDVRFKLPLMWVLLEGPVVLALGVAMLVLSRHVEPAPELRTCSG